MSQKLCVDSREDIDSVWLKPLVLILVLVLVLIAVQSLLTSLVETDN